MFMEGKQVGDGFPLGEAKAALLEDLGVKEEDEKDCQLAVNIFFKCLEDLKSLQKMAGSPANAKMLKGLRYHKRHDIRSTQFRETSLGMTDGGLEPIGKPIVHRGALQCTTGEAKFTDDLPRPIGQPPTFWKSQQIFGR